MSDDDLKRLWKEQPMTTTTLSLDELKAGAKRLHRRIVLRNALEYAACAVVIAGFAFYIVRFPFPLMRAGSVLLILGTLVVAWQLGRRASGTPLPTDLGGQSWLAFRRAQLVRQRDALRSVWLWYVAPLVPGIVVFRGGVETELDASAPFALGHVADGVVALVFLAVIALNAWGARRLQRRIDQIDRESA